MIEGREPLAVVPKPSKPVLGAVQPGGPRNMAGFRQDKYGGDRDTGGAGSAPSLGWGHHWGTNWGH